MGNDINGPVMLSMRNRGISDKIRYGVCEIQGWRKSMEDATVTELNFEENASIFGICDGHGGPVISQFVAANFLSLLTNQKSYKEGKIEDALIETSLIFDSLLRTDKVNTFLVDYQKKNIKQKELLKCSFSSSSPSSTSTSATNSPLLSPNDSLNKKDELFCPEKSLNELNQNSMHTQMNNSPIMNNNQEDKFNKDWSSVSFDNLHIDLSTASNSMNFTDNSVDDQLIDLKELMTVSSNTKSKQHYNTNRHLIANEMGTTANILLIKNNILYMSNVGDSLSVMYKNGKAIRLNREHNLSLKSEYKRLVKSNASISKKRIEGRLNLSRAIGDLEFKKNPNLKFYEQAVVALPEITKVELTSDIEFIIMACDGVWDCVEPQEFCDLIAAKIKSKHSIDFIIEEVFKEMIPETNKDIAGMDNMSCVIIQFI